MRQSGSMMDLDKAFKMTVNCARGTHGLFGGFYQNCVYHCQLILNQAERYTSTPTASMAFIVGTLNKAESQIHEIGIIFNTD